MSFLNSTYELYKAFKEPQGIKVLSQNHIGEQDTAYLNKSRTRARARSRSRARIGSGPETCGPYKDSVAWLPDQDCWAYPILSYPIPDITRHSVSAASGLLMWHVLHD